MAQIQVTEEYKKAVEAYEVAFGEKPPYCVKDPEYIMECVRRGEPSNHVPDPDGKAPPRRGLPMPSHPSAGRHSRIMPLAVLCLLGGISGMIGGVADGYEHGFGALRDFHGGNRYRRPWPKQVNSI